MLPVWGAVRISTEWVGKDMYKVVGDHSFSTFAKFLEELTFVTPWYARMWAYQGVRNVSSLKNFACVLNDRSFSIIKAYAHCSCVLIVVDFKQLLFYLFKLSNGNTRIKCEFCSKLPIKIPERYPSFWCLNCWLWTEFIHSSIFIADFEQLFSQNLDKNLRGNFSENSWRLSAVSYFHYKSNHL